MADFKVRIALKISGNKNLSDKVDKKGINVLII